jgi:ABC-type nitrate/sulfonate/bicarbonate transport system substrate-binding protein
MNASSLLRCSILLGLGLVVGLLGAAPDDIKPIDVPFIFWGGDVATFHANGGIDTTADCFYGKKGLKLHLVPGDDFDDQIKNYLAGKSPFLRGTLSMLGQVSERLTAKDETTPVVFLQLTWSAGDHLVGRKGLRDLNDIKGKKIALQDGGPHVGMLNDILHTARLDWKDVTVVWTKDVSGDKGPAALFRKDNSIDGCFVITPEMMALTSSKDGNTNSRGDGSMGSVKDAHVVVSTQHMSRSIADVYACRSDFYKANKEWVDKFIAGYLRSSEELIDLKSKFAAKDKTAEDNYQKVLKLAQGIWLKGPAFKEAVAKLDDVDGLISDAVFVGLPGNEAFFKAKGNLSGVAFKMKQACALPADPSKDALKKDPKVLKTADLDYDALRKLGELRGKPSTRPRIELSAEVKVEADTRIFTFKIMFAKNESEFSEATYAGDFQRALEVASLFGNTMVVIRGHSDPMNMVTKFIDAATNSKLGKQDGDAFVLADGTKIDLHKDTKKVVDIIASEPENKLEFVSDGRTYSLRTVAKSLQDLSEQRANRVQEAVKQYAAKNSLVLDPSQFRTNGVGPSEPEDGYPKTEEDKAKNRRVEFIILKVPDNKINKDPFDL